MTQRTQGEGEARRKNGGFTLIELLAVILVIAILMALGIWGGAYALRQANIARARAEIAAMSSAVEAFKSDNGYYPTSTIYRVSQTRYVQATNSWLLYNQLACGTKKYMTFKKAQLAVYGGVTNILDPWKHPYVYYQPNSNIAYSCISTGISANLDGNYTIGGLVNISGFDLFSCGPDGVTYVPGATYNQVTGVGWGIFGSGAVYNDPRFSDDDITNWK